MRLTTRYTAVALFLLLFACGGGGGGSSSPDDVTGDYSLEGFRIDFADGYVLVDSDVGYYVGTLELHADGTVDVGLNIGGFVDEYSGTWWADMEENVLYIRARGELSAMTITYTGDRLTTVGYVPGEFTETLYWQRM